MEELNTTEQWILDNKKVCLCMGIPRKVIVSAIKSGAATVADVNKKALTGRGGCGGKRCGATITEMLKEYQETGKI